LEAGKNYMTQKRNRFGIITHTTNKIRGPVLYLCKEILSVLGMDMKILEDLQLARMTVVVVFSAPQWNIRATCDEHIRGTAKLVVIKTMVLCFLLALYAEIRNLVTVKMQSR